MKTISHYILFIFVMLPALSACADKYMVPGGDSQINEHVYSGKQDLMDRIGLVKAGMPQKEVFEIFNVEEKDLIQINREEIMLALFGDNRIPMEELGNRDPNEIRQYLRELYGYKIRYKDTEKRHGFKDVIRYRTREEGFDYQVTLIFHKNYLFEKPILTGGAVKESRSVTIFDGFGFGNVLPAF